MAFEFFFKKSGITFSFIVGKIINLSDNSFEYQKIVHHFSYRQFKPIPKNQRMMAT